MRAVAILACHLALILLLILMFWFAGEFISFLWGVDEPMLFDAVPFKYLFQAIDVVFILVFAYFGIMVAIRELRKE